MVKINIALYAEFNSMSKSKGDKQSKLPDESTEQKIKEAARRVFHNKGFAATRTRDIAEESGINLALLNYYFRSKEKLFQEIMLETIKAFVGQIAPIVNNEKTTLKEKIELIVNAYIDFLTAQPDVPIFILSELRQNPEILAGKMGILEIIQNSVLLKQYNKSRKEGLVIDIPFPHFLMNLLGLTVFPFIASPMIIALTGGNKTEFGKLIQSRKNLIPGWMENMFFINQKRK